MAKILPKNRRTRILVFLAAFVVLVVVGMLGAWYIARPMYKNWREQRANQVARDFLEKKDYPNALLAVRKTLGYNQMNTDAWKLAVEITEKQGTHEVVFYQQHLANVAPTFENRLKFIKYAVQYNAFREADQMIAKIGEEGSKSAEFLELAALVSRRMGNPTKAKYYLMSLVSLQPDNSKAKFDLAQLRLIDGVTENKPSIRAELRNLATEPELRVRAYSLLLSDALQSQNSNDALELADQLAKLPDVTSPHQVLIAETYRRYAPARFKPHLTQMQEKFSGDPQNVIIITNYLVGNEMAGETRAWIDKLDEKVKKNEGVELTYAFALLLLRDYPALETFVKNCKWTENEFMRHALLAFRYRAGNRDRDFNEEWRLAVIEVGNNLRRLQTLLAQVTSWNWQDQRFELLWKRFTLEPSNQSIRNQLIVWERSRGNTAGLNRLFARIVEHDPRDMDAKNNHAYTSMLLGINLDRAYQSSREAYSNNQKNPFYATTQAFALYRQGKYEEAMEVMQALGVATLTVPERTMLQSVILIANGKFEEGASLAMPLKVDAFLPEERRLLTDALASVERSRRDQGSAARLAALTSGGTSADRKSWLNVIPSTLRENPSVQMELAENLYGSDDYKGLEASLKSDRWEVREFLRQALLAYAERQQGRESDSRSTWRIAVTAAGNNSENLSALSELANRWNWSAEHMDLISRLFQRDPSDVKAFSELVDYYSKNNQTGQLADLYRKRLEASPDDAEAKSRVAYYSLLINSNVSRAHVLAKEAYDAAPDNPFRAKVYVFSLYKQSRATDGAQVISKVTDTATSGPLQIALLKAALAAQQNQAKEARSSLEQFDAASALPEEAALADSIAKSLPPLES